MDQEITVLRRAELGPLEFTPEQRQLIRDAYANGASDAEFAVLMEIARARRLSPLLKQIHFVSRWNEDLGRKTWAAQTGIDGLRAIAERTGLYVGQDEPEFEENADGTLRLCRVRVWRRDWPRPAIGVAYWNEYVQTKRDGKPTHMWTKLPHVMLGKVAESIALRKAFPEDTSGVFSNEEMAQADSERIEVEQARPSAPPRPSLVAPPAAQQLPEADPLATYRVRIDAVASLNELVATCLELGPGVAKAQRTSAWELACARAAAFDASDVDFTRALETAKAITADPAHWRTVAAVLAGLSGATAREAVNALVRQQGKAVGTLPEALQEQLNAARTARLNALTNLAAGFEDELNAANDIPTLDAIADRITQAFEAGRLTAEQLTALTHLHTSLCTAMEAA